MKSKFRALTIFAAVVVAGSAFAASQKLTWSIANEGKDTVHTNAQGFPSTLKGGDVKAIETAPTKDGTLITYTGTDYKNKCVFKFDTVEGVPVVTVYPSGIMKCGVKGMKGLWLNVTS